MKRLAALALPALTLPALVLLPQAAMAHPGHGEAAGLVHGFLHPVSGADHVLAMVAVGLLAALRGGQASWALPAAFLTVMAAGAGIGMAGVGMAGIGLPLAEAGIALSVVAFGLAAVFGLRLPVAALGVLVGGFAVFHGYAHGAEMPETASGLVYGFGFLAGTALLHAVGLGLGRIAAGSRRTVMAPMLGGAVVASGVALLAGHF